MACTECDFEYKLNLAPTMPTFIRGFADSYAQVLRGDASALRRRPADDVWAPLEYACHVRDVLLVQRERLLAARRCDTPVAEPMGRDERVDHDGYADQHPDDVARQLKDAAALFAQALDRLSPSEWDRTLIYTYPERAERSLRWLALHTMHELYHHLADILDQLKRPGAGPQGSQPRSDP